MIELIAVSALIGLLVLAILLVTDSDDDNSGGGLIEPSLVPIPIKDLRS